MLLGIRLPEGTEIIDVRNDKSLLLLSIGREAKRDLYQARLYGYLVEGDNLQDFVNNDSKDAIYIEITNRDKLKACKAK